MSDQARPEQTNVVAMTPRTPQRYFSLVPTTMTEAMALAKMIASSEMVPKDYRGKEANVLIAIQMGLDVGLKPMQALQNIAIINGRPSIWGDAAVALAQNSGVIEWVKESFEGTKNADGSMPDNYTAVCAVKRKDYPEPTVRRFSVYDAKTAKLWGKTGQQGQPTPWVTYPERMLQMRARSFALRDAASDALMGLAIREEAEDLPIIDIQPVNVVQTEDGEVPAIYLKVPEGLRDAVERAFGALNMPKGLRLTKLNEFLGAADVDPELGTKALLQWCKEEYAARQGREYKAGPQNNTKAPQPSDSAATPPVSNSAQGSGATTGVDPSRGASDARPATVEGQQGAAPSGASAPLTAKDIPFGKLGF